MAQIIQLLQTTAPVSYAMYIGSSTLSTSPSYGSDSITIDNNKISRAAQAIYVVGDNVNAIHTNLVIKK